MSIAPRGGFSRGTSVLAALVFVAILSSIAYAVHEISPADPATQTAAVAGRLAADDGALDSFQPTGGTSAPSAAGQAETEISKLRSRIDPKSDPRCVAPIKIQQDPNADVVIDASQQAANVCVPGCQYLVITANTGITEVSAFDTCKGKTGSDLEACKRSDCQVRTCSLSSTGERTCAPATSGPLASSALAAGARVESTVRIKADPGVQDAIRLAMQSPSDGANAYSGLAPYQQQAFKAAVPDVIASNLSAIERLSTQNPGSMTDAVDDLEAANRNLRLVTVNPNIGANPVSPDVPPRDLGETGGTPDLGRPQGTYPGAQTFPPRVDSPSPVSGFPAEPHQSMPDAPWEWGCEEGRPARTPCTARMPTLPTGSQDRTAVEKSLPTSSWDPCVGWDGEVGNGCTAKNTGPGPSVTVPMPKPGNTPSDSAGAFVEPSFDPRPKVECSGDNCYTRITQDKAAYIPALRDQGLTCEQESSPATAGDTICYFPIAKEGPCRDGSVINIDGTCPAVSEKPDTATGPRFGACPDGTPVLPDGKCLGTCKNNVCTASTGDPIERMALEARGYRCYRVSAQLLSAGFTCTLNQSTPGPATTPPPSPAPPQGPGTATGGNVAQQDTYCLVSMYPVISVPIKKGQTIPANCINRPGGTGANTGTSPWMQGLQGFMQGIMAGCGVQQQQQFNMPQQGAQPLYTQVNGQLVQVPTQQFAQQVQPFGAGAGCFANLLRQQPPAGNGVPQAPGTCPVTSTLCRNGVLYGRNSQCVDTMIRTCEFGCNGNTCAAAPANQCPPAPPQPTGGCNGTYAEVKTTLPSGTSCTTGWRCDAAKPTIVIIANPARVTAGETARLGWITTGMKSCTVVSSVATTASQAAKDGAALFTAQNAGNTSPNGTAPTQKIVEATTFALNCTQLDGAAKSASTVITPSAATSTPNN